MFKLQSKPRLAEGKAGGRELSCSAAPGHFGAPAGALGSEIVEKKTARVLRRSLPAFAEVFEDEVGEGDFLALGELYFLSVVGGGVVRVARRKQERAT